MKLKLSFKPKNNYLIYDYKYYISSWIYSTIQKSDEDFSKNLHKKTNFKFFTFSNLFFKHASFFNDHIEVKDKLINLYISSFEDIFTKNLAVGILNSKLILGPNVLIPINIRNLKINFSNNNITNLFEYKTLSPITVTKSNYKEVPIYYPNPSENIFYELIKNNLLKKYKYIYNKEYLGDLIIKPSKRKIYSKLYSIKKGKIKGFEMGFFIKCSENMRKIILTSGLGEKNSIGFGMVDIINKGETNEYN